MIYSVYLNDSNIESDVENYFAEVAEWSKVNCNSYVNYDVVDVSDVSIQYDYIAQYYFRNKRDLVAFKLTWK
jgi:hypothetical protein